MAEEVIELRIDTKLLKSQTGGAVDALAALRIEAGEVAEAIGDAFRIQGYKDYLKTVKRFGKTLTDELLVMQLSFGSLKAAIADACAPLAAVFVPMINNAIGVLRQFADYAGQFFRGLIWGITGQDAMAASAEDAAAAEDKLADSAKKAGSAVRRSLMGFDQINRLNKGSGGGSSGGGLNFGAYVPGEISPQVQAVVDKILALLAPILAIDLEPLRQALVNLGQAFSHMATLVATGLEYMWYELLAPFVVWVMEEFAPALTNFWAAKLEMAAAALEPVMAGLAALWEAMKPVVAYIGEQVMAALSNWQSAVEGLAAVFREKNPEITGVLQNIATVLSAVWKAISPVLDTMSARFSQTFGNIAQIVASAMSYVIDALYGVSNYIAGVFTGDWAVAWQGLKQVVAGAINGIIGIMNYMLSAVGGAVNALVGAANRISFSIPAWVPVLGGRSFKVNLSYVSVPQIPLLAKGAVLPANKPFLAVVGDQKHGTNVEAPLEVIQQAVAQVMQDTQQGNMAGHNATVEMLRKILEAVLQIHIGDEVIATAVSRYNRKTAVMKGV